MKNIDIEFLPKAVKEKIISKQEAAKIIWEEIYTNPQRYGLMFFSEDQKSDLLLQIHKQFEVFFDKFIPGHISFKSFITSCLAKYKNRFLKHQLSNEIELKSLSSFFQSKIEEDSQKYMIDIAENDQITKTQCKKTFNDIIMQEIDNHKKREKRIAELTAIILLMKACKDIDDKTINLVSKFTGINKTLLYDTIEELKESMSRKEKNNQKLVCRRNNAFFFHRKYMQEMLLPSTSAQKLQDIQKKYEKQTNKWKVHNQELAIRSQSPSNEEIARIIGIKPRTVSFYINHARNNDNLKKIKNLYKTDEKNENEEIKNVTDND